jgi:hypothetical protein
MVLRAPENTRFDSVDVGGIEKMFAILEAAT